MIHSLNDIVGMYTRGGGACIWCMHIVYFFLLLLLLLWCCCLLLLLLWWWWLLLYIIYCYCWLVVGSFIMVVVKYMLHCVLKKIDTLFKMYQFVSVIIYNIIAIIYVMIITIIIFIFIKVFKCYNIREQIIFMVKYIIILFVKMYYI